MVAELRWNTRDDLNIYLVSRKVKPASIVSLDRSKMSSRSEYEEQLVSFFDRLEVVYPVDESGLIFQEMHNTYTRFVDGKPKTIKVLDYELFLGMDEESLMRLIRADSNEIGLALGFPLEDVQACIAETVPNTDDCIARALLAGVDVPTWLGYISFIPSRLDFISGDVSESAREVGERYQNFVRRTNPELAKTVEEDFLEDLKRLKR